MRYYSASDMYPLPPRRLLTITLLLLLAGLAPLSRAQEVESGIGPLPVFEFHSGFWVNLHQYLYYQARLREATPEARASAGKSNGPTLKQNPIALTAGEQKAWDEAIAYYRSNYAGKDPQVNLDLILLKNQLGDFEDCNELLGKKKRACDAGLPGNIGVILEAAAPIYRSHWWADQDRANRRWVARVAPLVREQGVGISAAARGCLSIHLAEGEDSRGSLRVRQCRGGVHDAGPTARGDFRHGSPQSGDECAGSSVRRGVARHCVPGGGRHLSRMPAARQAHSAGSLARADSLTTTERFCAGAARRPTGRAARRRGWHAGHETVERATGFARQIYQRGWNDYLRFLDVYWQPYLNGRVTFEDAIAHLVSAV